MENIEKQHWSPVRPEVLAGLSPWLWHLKVLQWP